MYVAAIKLYVHWYCSIKTNESFDQIVSNVLCLMSYMVRSLTCILLSYLIQSDDLWRNIMMCDVAFYSIWASNGFIFYLPYISMHVTSQLLRGKEVTPDVLNSYKLFILWNIDQLSIQQTEVRQQQGKQRASAWCSNQ